MKIRKLFLLMLLAPSFTFAALDKNLKYGSIGSDVRELQSFLFEDGCLTVSPTGNYLAKTYLAVKCFQTKYGIPSTGYFGPLTRMKVASMKSETSATATPVGALLSSTTIPVLVQAEKAAQGNAQPETVSAVQPKTLPVQPETGNGCLNKVKGDACSYGAAPDGVCDNALNGHLLFCIPKRAQ